MKEEEEEHIVTHTNNRRKGRKLDKEREGTFLTKMNETLIFINKAAGEEEEDFYESVMSTQ